MATSTSTADASPRDPQSWLSNSWPGHRRSQITYTSVNDARGGELCGLAV